MKISGAVFRELNSPLSVESLEIDEPRPDEVLVKVVATGVCHTDVALTHGFPFPVPRPMVLGHEGAGIVERVGASVTHVAPGDHVVLTFDHCGSCPHCADGAPAYCESFGLNFSGRRRDGSATLTHSGNPVSANFFGQSSFATYAIATERNTIKVPKHLPLELLGPLGCGIQTGAGAVINVLKPTVGTSIAIFGAGAVGLSALMAARLMGVATLIAVDLHEERLALAKELGATHVIRAGDPDVVKQIREISAKGVDFALDASGAPPAILAAISSLGVRGVCGIVGGGPPIMLDIPQLMQGGRTVRGIGMGNAVPSLLIPRLIDLYQQGRFPFDRLIRSYPLEKINEAFADSQSGKTIKPIIKM